MRLVTLEWRSYKYFPYERDFALLETESVLNTSAEPTERGLLIPATDCSPDRIDRLTYFSRATDGNGRTVVPRQARLELAGSVNGRVGQVTRYSAHGLHEYKGKFNPQIVRAIGNILGVKTDAWLLDPFCGSGTTLLESAHIGWSAVGTDFNPLAVRIANAKVRALVLANGPLERLAARIVDALGPYARALSADEAVPQAELNRLLGRDWSGELPDPDYLASWFPQSVLAQIVAAKRVLTKHVRRLADRAVFEVILSDQLRNASLQEPADLRIRRRINPQGNYALLTDFAAGVAGLTARVVAARNEIGEIRGWQGAFVADIRDADPKAMGGVVSGFDAVITSPPYATALPYIDTQRLSLVALGELHSDQLRVREKDLIGSRELGGRERRELETQIRERPDLLPASVCNVCQNLLESASMPGNGFRRRNVPALVYRYFRDMARFFVNVRRALRPGAPVALVVGTNRTTLGGTKFEIDTPALLLDTAAHHGYAPVLDRRMDTYPRYDLHQQNSIDAERLIVVEAPGA